MIIFYLFKPLLERQAFITCRISARDRPAFATEHSSLTGTSITHEVPPTMAALKRRSYLDPVHDECPSFFAHTLEVGIKILGFFFNGGKFCFLPNFQLCYSSVKVTSISNDPPVTVTPLRFTASTSVTPRKKIGCSPRRPSSITVGVSATPAAAVVKTIRRT